MRRWYRARLQLCRSLLGEEAPLLHVADGGVVDAVLDGLASLRGPGRDATGWRLWPRSGRCGRHLPPTAGTSIDNRADSPVDHPPHAAVRAPPPRPAPSPLAWCWGDTALPTRWPRCPPTARSGTSPTIPRSASRRGPAPARRAQRRGAHRAAVRVAWRSVSGWPPHRLAKQPRRLLRMPMAMAVAATTSPTGTQPAWSRQHPQPGRHR